MLEWRFLKGRLNFSVTLFYRVWLVGGVFKGFAVFGLIFCFFGFNWFGFGNSPSGGGGYAINCNHEKTRTIDDQVQIKTKEQSWHINAGSQELFE